MSFANWLRNGWLSPRRTTARDITDLLQVADRSLADSDAAGQAPVVPGIDGGAARRV